MKLHVLKKALLISVALLMVKPNLSFSAVAATANEKESNNTLATANSMTLSTTMTGTISSSSDQDWFKFTTSSKGVHRIGLSNIPSNADYDLALFDANSKLIANSGTSNKYESICTSLNASTTYYLKVFSANGYSTTEKYQLRISTTEQSRENWGYVFRGSKTGSRISQDYSSSHYGLDIVHATQGEIANGYTLYSVKSGTVLYSATAMSSTAGWYVVIKLDSDYGSTETVRYLHMKNQSLLKDGDKVTINSSIGIVGKTGYTSDGGEHLHFDVNTVGALYGGSGANNVNYDTTVDPKPYFSTIINFT